jgi:rhamnogalacturonyl hydrolase YesR/lysophospholipase L1-like esterase
MSHSNHFKTSVYQKHTLELNKKMVYLKKFLLLSLFVFYILPSLLSQQEETLSDYIKNKRAQKKQAQAKNNVQQGANDSSTPLHLIKPDYNFEYGVPDTTVVKAKMNSIYSYLNNVTPAKLEDSRTKAEITDTSKIDRYSQLKRGDFRIASYEWGVTYSGMIRLAEITGDNNYFRYASDRFKFLADIVPSFKKQYQDVGNIDDLMKQIIDPDALDDAGAMCAAMIRASLTNKDLNVRPLIDNYIKYIMYQEFRLYDGTFARNRPHRNTVWLDDMYMSIPAIVSMGKLTGEAKYYNEAAKQVLQFADRMFVPEKNLFRHGWVQEMKVHPSFFWGRANGWALLTMCDVLDVLPPSHPSYNKILELLQLHIQGLAERQADNGFWHQLLDRNESYLETSATAIYTYGIAHAINKGWVDAKAYGPVALLGWSAVASQINNKGQVEGTCVGTGMGFESAYYDHRPVSAFAAHGYGPTLLAGAEIINLCRNWHPRLNDSAIQFYAEEQKMDQPIFAEQDNTQPPARTAGKSRKGNNPAVLIIGDSTVKNGRGNGDNGQWGWGNFFENYFDTTRITLENHALGGRSSRTFITEGRWANVLNGLKKGDYLLIQFGHNDGGPLNTGRARASLPGTGEEMQTVIMERNGGPEDVFTFGHYMRIYIRQAKAQGAIPIILSPTPQNRWQDNTIARYKDTYTKWCKEVAEAEGVAFIDLNEISALKLEKMGKEQAQALIFKDSVHTSKEGAIMNCESIVDALKQLSGCDLKNYIK